MNDVKRCCVRFTAMICLIGVLLSGTGNVRAAGEEEALSAKISQIVSEMPTSCNTDFEKALYLHDYIVNHTDYLSNAHDQTAYGALVLGKAVCAGYADAYLKLLNAVHITSHILTGTANNGQKTMAHAWNLVYLDGKCYYTDVTWDDPVTGDGSKILTRSYFNLTLEQISWDHYPDVASRKLIPATCGHTGMDYYSMMQGPGTGIGILTSATTPEQAEKFFNKVTNSDGTVEFICEFRLEGIDGISWVSENKRALIELLGLTSAGFSMTTVGNTFTVVITTIGITCQHKSLQKVNAVEPGCEVKGNTVYYICENCNTWFGDSEGKKVITDHKSVDIPAAGHQISGWKSDDSCHWKQCMVSGCTAEISGTRSIHIDANGDSRCDTCSAEVINSNPTQSTEVAKPAEESKPEETVLPGNPETSEPTQVTEQANTKPTETEQTEPVPSDDDQADSPTVTEQTNQINPTEETTGTFSSQITDVDDIDDKNKLPMGYIIVAGTVAVLGGAAFAVWYLVKKRRL